jgi:hypothetical protein
LNRKKLTTRYSEWMPMSALPDYGDNYDVEVDGRVMDAEYSAGKWGIENAARWRGRRTKLRKSEITALKEALGKHPDSPANRRDAALAALQLARAAQERAARSGKRAALKTACRYFHIAAGLDATLQARDEKFMSDWSRINPMF